MGFLTLLFPLLSGLFGESGPVGQYLKNKAAQVQAEEEYKLSLLKANAEAATQATIADTAQRANYLGATSQRFRQGTFYWISAIIFYSIIRPNEAEALWHNFNLIPEWVQCIYLGMLAATWGLPIAKENIGLVFSSIGRGMAASRDFKLAKAQINHKVVIDSIRKALYPNGMNPVQVAAYDKALDEGEASQ